MADIFAGYTASDRAWAFWIAKELEALGHRPHVHEWEIESGAWIEQRDDADHNWTKDSAAGVPADAMEGLGRAAEAEALRQRYRLQVPNE